MSGVIATNPKYQFSSAAGVPLVSGTLTVYLAGTTTPTNTWTDSALTSLNTNPITLDARGECVLWLDSAVSYKFVLKNAAGVTQWTQDNISGSALGSFPASLAASGGSALVNFLQAGTGAVARTSQSKMRDVVSILDFGVNTTPGTTDMTTAIQAALDSGAKSVYIPSGTYLTGALTMPNVFGFVLYGDGPSSVLKMKATAGIGWSTAAMVYDEQTIRNIAMNGSAGTGHCIDLSGAGGATLEGVYITDVPVGKAGVYVNGAAATYSHDQRINGLQVYTNTAGLAGVEFGPLCADAELRDFIMNGNFVTSYCIKITAGATSIQVADSHPYNAADNIVLIGAGANLCQFDNCRFDNATNNLVVAAGLTSSTFTGCLFQAVKSGKSAVSITTSSNGVAFRGCLFDGAAGAVSCVVSASGSSSVSIEGGSVTAIGNFSSPFNLGGTNSFARGIAGWNPMGMQYQMVGITTAAQAQNTTQYLGVNGGQASEGNTQFMAPQASKFTTCYVIVDATPAAGQTMTFTARVNGVDTGTPLVVSNGGFGGVMTVDASVSQYARISIKSVFSATSGSASIRYIANLTA